MRSRSLRNLYVEKFDDQWHIIVNGQRIFLANKIFAASEASGLCLK